jgi:hypothetical protein
LLFLKERKNENETAAASLFIKARAQQNRRRLIFGRRVVPRRFCCAAVTFQ